MYLKCMKCKHPVIDFLCLCLKNLTVLSMHKTSNQVEGKGSKATAVIKVELSIIAY